MSIFREKSLERISSPEELDSYLRIANPPLWVALSAVVLLLTGALVWGIFGTLESSVPAVTVCTDADAICYVSEQDYDRIELADEVHIGELTAHVTEANAEAVRAESVLNEYAMHLCELDGGEFVHALRLDVSPAEEGSYASAVVVERISAIRFLWN